MSVRPISVGDPTHGMSDGQAALFIGGFLALILALPAYGIYRAVKLVDPPKKSKTKANPTAAPSTDDLKRRMMR